MSHFVFSPQFEPLVNGKLKGHERRISKQVRCHSFVERLDAIALHFFTKGVWNALVLEDIVN